MSGMSREPDLYLWRSMRKVAEAYIDADGFGHYVFIEERSNET